MFPPIFNVSSINGTNGFVIEGYRSNVMNFGDHSVGIGDFNGDGIEDAAFSWHCQQQLTIESGIYIFFGTKQKFPPVYNISVANSENLFLSASISEGCEIVAGGELNNDRFSDLIVGCLNNLYVVFGSDSFNNNLIDLSTNSDSHEIIFDVEDEVIFYPMNDFNGDGIKDFLLILGRSQENTICIMYGPIMNYFGAFNIRNVDRKQGLIIEDKEAFAAINLEDFNGDGLSDIIVSSKCCGSGGYVLFGNNYNVSFFLPESIDGKNGFFILGLPYFTGNFYNIISAGDINGDGLNDIMTYGRAPLCIIYGNKTFSIRQFSVHYMDGQNGFCTIQNISHAYALGDVNKDSYDDILITSDNSRGYINYYNILYGNKSLSNPLGSEIYLSKASLHVPPLYQINSAGASDINDDGVTDIMLTWSNINLVIAPAVFGSVIFGSSRFLGSIELQVLNGIDGFNMQFVISSDITNFVVRAGDINNDGICDIAIASPAQLSYIGQVSIIFGQREEVYNTIYLPTILKGMIVQGRDVSNTGVDSRGIGDFNGDGVDDLILCFYKNVYVLYGSDALPLSIFIDEINGFIGFKIVRDQTNNGDVCNFARGIGDVNLDGLNDVMLSIGEDELVLFGHKNYYNFNTSQINGTNGFFVQSDTVGSQAFAILDGMGDVNGKKQDNFVFACQGEENYEALCIVFASRSFGKTFFIQDLNGENGFIVYQDTVYSNILDVKINGDVNGDGLDDIVVLSYSLVSIFGLFCDVSIDILFGGEKFAASIFLSSLTTQGTGFSIKIPDIGNAPSINVGDVNGDGLADIALATQLVKDGYNGQAQVYLIYGKQNFTEYYSNSSSSSIIIQNIPGGGSQGQGGLYDDTISVSLQCDFNNDGINDIVIGTPGDGNGRSYVIFGQAAQPLMPLSPSSPVSPPPYETPWWEYAAIAGGSAAAVAVVGLAYWGYHKYKSYISPTTVETEFNELVGEDAGVI